MTAEQAHYYSDRLVRACARGASLSAGQRAGLAEEVLANATGNEPMLQAARDLAAGKLTEAQVVALYKAHRIEGFDLDAYRQSLKGKTSGTPALDTSIAALLQSAK